MGYKVYIPQPIAEEGRRYLLERGYEIVTGTGLDEQVMMAEIAHCDAALARTEMYTANVLNSGKQLKVVARHGVGIDNIDVKTATELGIYVTTTPLANAGSVAEHVMCVLLALAKRLLPLQKAFQSGDYAVRNRISGVDVEGKTLGIIGFGKIGSALAKKAAHGFDMRVIAYDPYLRKEAVPSELELVDDLGTLLRQSDFVSVHVPSSPETNGLIGREQLAMMKPTAYLINAARGEIVREADLVDALQQGTIAGAALDVFEVEPPDRDNPLLHMEQVISTPHSAALSVEARTRMAQHAAISIDEVLSGKTPSWPANVPQHK